MLQARIIGSVLMLTLLSACLANQPTERQNATAEVEIQTASMIFPSKAPTISATSEINQCIPAPSIDSLLLQSFYQVNLAEYEINMKSTSEPVLSPNNQYLALSLYEVNEDKRLSRLAVLNIKENTTTWLLEYQSVKWSGVDVAWSPDSQWVAFLPQNISYSDDGGLWVFDTNGQKKYQQERATSIVGWDENSGKIYFHYKDAFGFVNVQDWKVTFGERCP